MSHRKSLGRGRVSPAIANISLTLNNLQDVFRRRTRHGKLGGGNPLGRLFRNGRIFLLVPEW